MDYGIFECGHCGKIDVADFDSQVDPYCYECDAWLCDNCGKDILCPQSHEGPALRDS